MLSRVAASLYSAARLLERGDHLARLLDVHAGAYLDRPGAVSADYWDRFLGVCGLAAEGTGRGTSREAAVQRVVGAIAGAVADARGYALAVRPSISTEVFQELNVLHWGLQESSRPDLHEFMVRIEFGVHLVSGLVDDSMAHDDAWSFMRLGKHLERAQNVVRLVARKLSELDRADPVLWAGVLRCCWAFEAYRWRLSVPVTAERVAAFLLLDRELPRSAGYCVTEALAAVRRIDEPGPQSGPHRLLGRLASLFEYADPADVAVGASAFAADFVRLSGQLEAELAGTYFQPTSVAAPVPVVVAPLAVQQ